MPEESVFRTGWGKVAWIYEDTNTIIYADGSRSDLEDVELTEVTPGVWRDDNGVYYRLYEEERGGGHLVFDSGVCDLVNTVTFETHRWPPVEACEVSFQIGPPQTVRGPKTATVVCVGPSPDPLCGRTYLAPQCAFDVGEIVPMGG